AERGPRLRQHAVVAHVAHADVADAVFVIRCLSSPRTRGPISQRPVVMGPRNGVPATLASRGAPRGDDKALTPSPCAPCPSALRRLRRATAHAILPTRARPNSDAERTCPLRNSSCQSLFPFP